MKSNRYPFSSEKGWGIGMFYVPQAMGSG